MDLSILFFVIGCILIMIGYVNNITAVNKINNVKSIPKDKWTVMVNNSIL